MTKQEFVKKEVESASNEMFPIGNEHESKMIARQEYRNGMSYGLYKGLEIAEEFAGFASKYKYDDIRGYCSMFNDGSHGKSHLSPKFYTTAELFELFLTEKYGK